MLPSISESTAQFEEWLRSRMALREADLQFKHEQMATGAFPFMRATFYRWVQLWPVLCRVMVARSSHDATHGTPAAAASLVSVVKS